jgi:hypothetical protein
MHLVYIIILALIAWYVFFKPEMFVSLNADDTCEDNFDECIPKTSITIPYEKTISEFATKYNINYTPDFTNFKTENSFIFPYGQQFKTIIETYLNDPIYIVSVELSNIKSQDNVYSFYINVNNTIELYNINVLVTLSENKIIGFNVLLPTSNTSFFLKTANQNTNEFKLKNEYGLFYPFNTSRDEMLIETSL